MSLAWTTILVLFLLLPGIAFFGGLYSPDRYSRDFGRRNPFGELALAIFVATTIHLTAFILLQFLNSIFASIELDNFLARVASLKWKTGHDVVSVIRVVPYFVSYLLVVTIISFLIGLAVGQKVISGPLRFLAKHRWIYELIDVKGKKGIYPIVYVMTHVQYEDKILMYRGRLHEFFVNNDGRVSYLVLKDCHRFYMHLADTAPQTSAAQYLLPIEGVNGDDDEVMSSGEWPYLLIEGEDIANVVFDRTSNFEITKSGQLRLDELEQEFLRALIEAEDQIEK